LSEFRARLLADGQTERLLGLLLDRLRERGLLGKSGRQRTDATHVRMRSATCTGWNRSSRPSAPRWRPWRSWRLPGWAG
jgi:hypothetical protein